MTNQTISFATLPSVGADLEGGTFAGVITSKDGTHSAVILLPEQGSDLNWKKAGTWAKAQGGELPTRPVAALLFANVKDKLRPDWHWTSEEDVASYAWYCRFLNGFQYYDLKSYDGAAVAVRLIQLTT